MGDDYELCDNLPAGTSAGGPIIRIIDESGSQCPVEIASVESSYARNLTPEGNVKYKNYRALAPGNAPLRMYSPTGDIKKENTMPRYEHFDDATTIARKERLLTLIDHAHPCDRALAEIIKPSERIRDAIEQLRRTNTSSMDDYLQFYNTAIYSPSPCFSTLSQDSPPESPVPSRMTPSPMDPPVAFRNLYRSKSIDVAQPSRIRFERQLSVPSDGLAGHHMCLSDELSIASGDNRPLSALSEDFGGRMTPLESRRMIMRSFVQRNMIMHAGNRDALAKMALAVEEDSDEIEDGCAFASVAKLLDERIGAMLEEIADMKDDLMEIQDDIEGSKFVVHTLIKEAKSMSKEIEVINYLDDVIALLNDEMHLRIGPTRHWPFLYPDLEKRDPNLNLIV